MLESIINSLLLNNKITKSEIYDIYSKSTDEYEKKLLSMVNRISDSFSLTYGDDYLLAKKAGELVICFKKYYTFIPKKMWVSHSSSINEYTITFDDGNSVTYINPIYVELSIKEYFES